MGKNRWVQKMKHKTDGSIYKYRARLVVKGCQQRAGYDHKETFSPVVKYDSIRTIPFLVASKQMQLKQFDVKTAFLHGELHENVYIIRPQSFQDGSQRVCKLNKSLHGLKRQLRCWNSELVKCLRKHNLKPTDADACVFTSPGGLDRCLILAIFVDDGLGVSRDTNKINNLLEYLKLHFEIKINKLDMFLIIQISRCTEGSLNVHRGLYTERILDKFNMTQAHTVCIPTDVHRNLSLLQTATINNPPISAPYTEAVAFLLFLALLTTPDISDAVHMVSQFSQNPKKIHWEAVNCILKYLKFN